MSVFTVPLPPSNNHFKRHFCTGRINKSGVHIISARLTEKALQYKHDAGYLAKQFGIRMIERPQEVWVRIDLYERGDRSGTDIDNVQKVLFDAMNGVAWEDDSQVAHFEIERHRGDHYPSMDVEIHEYYTQEDAYGKSSQKQKSLAGTKAANHAGQKRNTA